MKTQKIIAWLIGLACICLITACFQETRSADTSADLPTAVAQQHERHDVLKRHNAELTSLALATQQKGCVVTRTQKEQFVRIIDGLDSCDSLLDKCHSMLDVPYDDESAAWEQLLQFDKYMKTVNNFHKTVLLTLTEWVK